MADLVDASTWAGIRQIETTDPVVGGVPNLGTGAGMSNIPHLLLANRTKFLRDQIDGAGIGLATMAAINNLDTLTKNGHYNFSSGATGAPITGTGTVIHAAGAASTEATQTVRMFGSDRTFERRRAGGAWQAWTEVWRGGQATASLGLPGYQVMPSGLILQWGQNGTASGAATGTFSLTFPIAFPTECFFVLPVDPNNNVTGAPFVVSVSNAASTTGVDIGWYRVAGASALASIHWLALGR